MLERSGGSRRGGGRPLPLRGRHHRHLLPAVLPTPTPLRRNIRFFPDPAAAEAAGLCPCKRCPPTLASPLAWHVGAVGKACSILNASERAPQLAAVVDAVGVSRFHFHRVFKDVLGTPPGEYSVRWRRLAQGLASGRSVTAAIYGAGYGSVSHVYENARKALGMTPAARRAGVRVRFAIVEQGTKQVLVDATDEGVCAIEFGDDPAELEARLRRQLPAAAIQRFDSDAMGRVASAARRAELPPQALGLPADVRDVAFRVRLRRLLEQGSNRWLPAPGRVSVKPSRRPRRSRPRRTRPPPFRTPGEAGRPPAAWISHRGARTGRTRPCGRNRAQGRDDELARTRHGSLSISMNRDRLPGVGPSGWTRIRRRS